MPKDERVGRILVGRYRMRRPIGTGAHGRVYLAEDLGRGGAHVAVKVVEGLIGGPRRDEADEVLRWFRHPNWADVTDSGSLGEDAWFQVARYVPGKSLDAVEGAQSAAFVWRFLEDGARVLGALHRQGLIHYDVTPGNWLVHHPGGQPRFVLTDGGLAHVGAVSGFARGTPRYMAPEVTEDGGHDHRADLYSLGLVAFRLATGRDAIEGGAGDVLGRRRREDAPGASTLNPAVPPELDRLLADLLARDPNARPHDAFALLERIDEHVEREVPPIRGEEGIASAAGGALVGRETELARFQESLGVLVQRVPVDGRSRAPRPAPVVKDAVLVLRGAPGSGTTRLAEEMSARARHEDVPVLVMSGRETATDRRGPLRHLVDGLSALGLQRGQEAPRVRLELDSKEGVGLEERSHATGRAIEQFVRAVEQAAKRTPFILVVEDLSDLPGRAREAIAVLSRHLLSRRESSGGTSALPVTMVVDLGSAEHEELLIPDSLDPERPVLELPALESATLRQICTTRFPSLEIDGADLDKVERVSEGRPATLVSLLGEACRRRDLRSESGQWLWNVDELDEYEIERGLSPVHADALRKADDRLLELLRYLSLVDSPLGEDVVRQLWDPTGSEPLPTTPLIRTFTGDLGRGFALAGLAARAAVRRRSTTKHLREAARRLARLQGTAPEPGGALDLARLWLIAGSPADSIDTLAGLWGRVSHEARLAAQEVIAEAVDSDASLRAAPATRARVAKLLEHGAHAVHTAGALAGELPEVHQELEVAERLAAVLEHARHHRDAFTVINGVTQEATKDSASAARIFTKAARLQFDLQQEEAARDLLKRARAALRRVRREDPKRRSLLAAYLMVEARSCFVLERPRRAQRCLRAALVAAKRDRAIALRVKALNNLGIVCQQAHDYGAARKHFERSLRLRKLIGDIGGVVKTTLNLGRLAQLEGELVRSASQYQAAAAVALRHAQYVSLSGALRALGKVYDQQLNARLAATTMLRAVQVGRRVSFRVGVALASWELAPLAASCGQHALALEMLRESADAARSRVTDYARATHAFVSALTHIHLGTPEKAAVHIRRLEDRLSTLSLETQRSVGLIWRFLSRVRGEQVGDLPMLVHRPARTDRSRFLYRAATWFRRTMRDESKAPPIPLGRFVPSIGAKPSALGRDRRILVEMALLASKTRAFPDSSRPLPGLERHLAQTGESRLQSRTLALLSVQGSRRGPAAAAQEFSRAVDMLSNGTAHAASPIPVEHIEAASRHAAQLEPGPDQEQQGKLNTLHALAHRLLVKHGCTAAPDRRVASALRRVLEATGRINAGAGLDDLLEALTQHTIEVTGAERACVVLVEREDERQVRVVQSASVVEDSLGMEDLSHTVIQRVLASAEPLLLHDVFDDQELMGRPSITSLSLRSILCVPMLRGDSLYGVMYADSSSAAGSFDQVDLEVLSLFAEQAAAALETHRLVADLQNSMAELKAMQERLVRGERLRTMGELSSGVAHEFNNLLTSILARVQLIGLAQLDADLRHDLEMIERACLDAAEVVRRLQSYAKQQRQGDFKLLDIADICRDSIEFLRPLWTGRRRHGRPPVQVRLRAASGLHVMGNATEMREVVTNLVKNALDALGGGGSITVSATCRDDQVGITVEDDGPGVPYEIQSKIFDPFYTTKGERGTGLGLALSQQIVERHGGTLEMSSTPDVGTTMYVSLPPAETQELDQQTTMDGREQDAADATSVVVVDDDENVLLPLCKYLERAGYKAIPARSGAEGLAAVEEHQPDIVISDVGMPGMDGLELCRRLRASAPDLPVVLMSGWAGSADPPRATQAGAAALLSKPFALRQVSELIDAVRARSA